MAEMAGKIRAAVDARIDDDLLIITRTESLAAEGFDAALDRISAYIDADAGVGFVEVPESVEQLREIPGREPRVGVVNTLEGGQKHRTAIWTIREALRALEEDSSITTVVDRWLVSPARDYSPHCEIVSSRK